MAAVVTEVAVATAQVVAVLAAEAMVVVASAEVA